MSFLRRFFSHSTAVIGFAIFVAIVVIALAAPLIFTRGPFTIVGMPLLPPGSPGLLAGSDVLGRDMIVGLAYGARISLLVGITSTSGAIGIGVLLGAIAGYYGGVVDDLLMRITEFFQIIPTFVLLMVLVAFMQPSLGSAVIGIALISWPQVARVVRGEFLTLREREFVQAARVSGADRLQHHLHSNFAKCAHSDRSNKLYDGRKCHLDRIGLELSRTWRPEFVELGQHDRRLALCHVGGMVDDSVAGRLYHDDGSGVKFHR